MVRRPGLHHPADLDQVTQDTTIYAKYVSDSYLDLAYSRTGLFRLRGVTLISAVDNPANYQASGIMVNGQKIDVSYASRYRIFKTPANLFGAARDAKLMLADKSLSGTGTLEVTPIGSPWTAPRSTVSPTACITTPAPFGSEERRTA